MRQSLRRPLQALRSVMGDFAGSEHERLLAALKASRAGTWRWNIAADILEWDDALCDVYGIKPENAPTNAQQFLALVHPEDQAKVSAAINTALENGADAEFQFRAVIGDAVRWIYDRSGIVRDEVGKPAYMLGACLDIKIVVGWRRSATLSLKDRVCCSGS